MSCICRLLLALALAGLVVAPNLGTADIGPVLKFKGGAATPKSPHQTIRLDSQEVTIRLKKKSYLVDVVFRFFNTGETSTEWVGFPKRIGYRGASPNAARFIRFDTWANGKKVAVSEEPDLTDTGTRNPMPGEDNRWMVHQITFPGDARTTIRVSYEAPYERALYWHVVRYVYGTGSSWMGKIGKAVFIIDGTERGGTKDLDVTFKPPVLSRRLVTEKAMRYEIREIEPQPDAEIEVLFK